MTKAKKPDGSMANARAAKMERVRKITAEIRATLRCAFHRSGHNERYGEDGLPVCGGSHFDLTNIEPALRD
jgi:hypothetical protein